MEKENTLATVVVTSIVVIFGTVFVTSGISDSDTGSQAGWTSEHIIWAYNSCISEGGAGDMVTGDGVNNYLQFCKKAIACAADSVPAAEVNVGSYDSLSNLLARCDS